MPLLAKQLRPPSPLRPFFTKRLLPQLQHLHLAPPFLLDDYTPRYTLLSSTSTSQKRSQAYAHLRNCNLCPRLCGVNRYERTGVCLIGAEMAKVNTIAPHFGEEPCIQGHGGSGSVFFSGCNLRCVFCQNHDIAHQRNGFDVTPEELVCSLFGAMNFQLTPPLGLGRNERLVWLFAHNLCLVFRLVLLGSEADAKLSRQSGT